MSGEVVYYENFKEIEKKIWSLLSNAVKDRSSEFRTPVFICGNENEIDGRIVVLRKADKEKNFIQFHSDIRSSKIEKIKKNPHCSILFYGKEDKIQLRLKIHCQINFSNEITKESWKKTGHVSRKCYLVADAPGTTPTTLGGITVAGNTWWKNKTEDASGDTSFKTITGTNFYEGMIRMANLWNATSEGNEQPTNIFTTNSIYASFEEIFEGTGYQRLSGNDSPGVDGRLPSFRGIPVQYDRDCGSGRMYFFNTNYLKMHMQSGMNFSKTPFRENSNQLAKVAFITVGLQVVTNNRRRQGVITGIS